MEPIQTKITNDVIKNSQNLKCDCGSMIFSEKLMFKKISAILSPTSKEEIVPLPIMICEKCGKVPSLSLFDPYGVIPKELKASNLSVVK